MRDFVAVRDDDPKLHTVQLTTIQLVAEGGYKGIWCVVPRGKKTLTHFELLLVGDFLPRGKVVEESNGGEFFVSNIVLLFVSTTLPIDRGDDELHASGVDYLMKLAILEEELVGVLNGDDVLCSGLHFDVRAGPGQFRD